MKVLLVDDETRVVEGLTRMLYSIAPEWDVEGVYSGAEAISRLGEDQFDVVISDMMMPLMSGAELLERVRAVHPTVARIILSGQTDRESSLRVLNVAHQFLSKPCPPERLVASVARLQDLRRELEAPEILARVGLVQTLPAAPRLYLEVNRLLASEDPPSERIAALLAADPAMAAKILQLGNSAFFGRAAVVSSIEVAIQRLGLSLVRDLVLAAEVFGAQVEGLSEQVDHYQREGLVASRLARALVEEHADAELAATAALLSDVGRLVEMVEPPWPKGPGAVDLHHLFGAYLLSLWSLPPLLVEAVARHHQPQAEITHLGPCEAAYLAHALLDDDPRLPEVVKGWGRSARLASWRAEAARLQRGDP